MEGIMAMNQKTKKSFEDIKVDTKIVLAGLWIVLELLYLYCDVLTFFKTDTIKRILSGFMGPFVVNQTALLTASLLMIMPALMVFLCLIIKSAVNRWINIVAGIAYTLVGIGNMIGETWIYYIVFVTIELMVTASIIIISIKWPSRQR
jgi:hypothetical protein